MMGLSTGLGVGAMRRVGGGVVPPPAGQTLATLPVTPYARWHPAFSTVTQSSGRVVSASDLQGVAAVTEGATGIGPQIMTDANGRKFWRFNEAEFLNIAAALTLDNRNCSTFFVGRVHRSSPGCPIFSGGNVAQGSQLSGGNMLDVAKAGNSAPFLRCSNRAGTIDTTNAQWMVAGSQMQVMGTVSRTAALGAISMFINDKKANTNQNSISRPVLTGGEIGRNPVSTSQFGCFDLYELVVYNTALSDADAALTQTALMDNFAIVPVVNQIVLEGDSITQGTALVVSGVSSGAVLAEPGAGRIPANWRVVNVGTSGSQVAEMLARRDDAAAWAAMLLAGGQNVVAFEIGRNDFGNGSKTPAQHYAAVVAYLNTATTGVLQRGWTVRAMANIATSAVLQGSIETHRAAMRAPAFLTDTLTGAGQTYAGKLSVVSTDLIEHGGARRFYSDTDAADTTYYAGDTTHPSILGASVRVTGGTTPQYGIAYGLT